jgi:diguanylate cyclase (GGDEF)-like protein
MKKLFGLHHHHTRLYIVMCFIPISIFSCIHYHKSNYFLALGLLVSAITFAYSFLRLGKNGICENTKHFIIISMWCNLAMASYILGIHGIIYVFPCIIALFFLKPIRTAIIISLISVLIFLVLIPSEGSLIISLRLFTTMALTIVFTAFFAYSSRFQQQALDNELRKEPLTNMQNRHAFNEWLNNCINESSVKSITLLQIDLDNFRTVNENFGFDAGDKMIQQLASKLLLLLKNDITLQKASFNFIAHFSGDVFAIGMVNLPSNTDMEPLTSNLQLMVSQLKVTRNHSTVISSSIGIAQADRVLGEFPNIIGNVDSALRQAKMHGKNKIKKFDKTFTSILAERKTIAKELPEALKANQFHMAFMPIYKDSPSNIIGAELLLRCDRKEMEGIGPDKYIPIAESCGLIIKIDYWVLEESFKIISSTPMLNLPLIEFYSINISSNQLHNDDFITDIKQLVIKYEIITDLIKLEITETSLVEADYRAVDTLIQLKRLGFHLSLDDYGTGFTSFNQLKKYPLDSLKIDKSFVSGDNDNNAPIEGMADVILSIANLYNFKVIAEGVETEAQYLKLKESGCHYFQGYFFSHPLPIKEYVNLLAHTASYIVAKPVEDKLIQ